MDQIENVKSVFLEEFKPIKDVFEIDILSYEEATDMNVKINRPGVYIFVNDKEVIRVGRSLYNAQSRSLEVIKYFKKYSEDDNTEGKKMHNFITNPSNRIIYITVENDKFYWTKTLESYLEDKLKPLIETSRR
jgi:hypothetical protein